MINCCTNICTSGLLLNRFDPEKTHSLQNTHFTKIFQSVHHAPWRPVCIAQLSGLRQLRNPVVSGCPLNQEDMMKPLDIGFNIAVLHVASTRCPGGYQVSEDAR